MTDELTARRNEIIRLIPDSVLRDIIFESGETSSSFLSNIGKYIDYFKNTLYLVTLITYKKFVSYKAWFEELDAEERAREIASFSNSMVRLYNMFDECYSTRRLDFNLVENVLLNLQVDSSLSPADGFIQKVGMEGCFNFSVLGNDLSKFIFALKKRMLSSRYDAQFGFDSLKRFFRAFPFLGNASAEYVPLPCCNRPLRTVNLTIDGEKLCLDELLTEINGQIDYLYGVWIDDPRKFTADNPQKSQMLAAEYAPLFARMEYKIVFLDKSSEENAAGKGYKVCVVSDTAIEDFMFKYRLFNVPGGSENYFFRDFFFVDNKYIKYLAMTISDLISIDSKRKVYNHYRNDYGEVFKKLGNSQIIHWDEIFIFLLLEVGIYNLLTYLFKNTDLSYNAVKNAFRLRFGENVKKLEDTYEIIRDPTSKLTLRNANNIVSCQVQALIFFATKLLTANEVSVSFNESLSSVAEILDDINNVYENASLNPKEKVIYYVNKIINFNMFIVVFYDGLLSYYDKQKIRDIEESEMLFFSDSGGKQLSSISYDFFRQATSVTRRNIYERYNTMCLIKDFDGSTLEKLKSLVKDSFEELEKLNASLNVRNTNKNEQFYDMTGKRSLINSDRLAAFKQRIISSFGDVRSVDSWLGKLHENFCGYLGYMRDGSPEKDAPIEGAIYPVIGICSQSVMSQDGYRYAYLSVDSEINKRAIRIKIISNEVLRTGEAYYCVPNVKKCLHIPGRSGKVEYVWINPHIIPYNAYLPNVSASFEQLENKEDYKKAAELIYCSDIMYRRMFGNMENAVKVLEILFDKGHSVFNKRYVRLLRISGADDNGVIAAATLYRTLPAWDENVMVNAFNAAKVPVTDETRSAFESLCDTFDDAIGDNYYVSDICVDENYRNRGYGKCMLNNIIRVAEKQTGVNVVLSVYENNISAMSLYNLMGFIPYVSAYDNRGEGNNHKEKYFKMIKYT